MKVTLTQHSNDETSDEKFFTVDELCAYEKLPYHKDQKK